ncbi:MULTISPECIES: DUF2110 family protein [Haloarcula]|uniref:DUF2110 family protein n=1 Tax=Haloarcula pellucida TaxID=1427151 RepID=A0A830GIY5_9EURY|nr:MULTISPECIES: DUF2110 family protein [Halomicroarcula]MBX0347583.1 DUF2110 family protein [Halomicroarcula pellucida]MDS0276495.1 DUF2110 family protein [Halomicroarcula sp. S1AR25-4]GGN89402.1 hypothetical protein GCM10009030_10100 [Halomicroarcula pellucida]
MVVLGTKVYVTGDTRDRALDGLRSLVANELGDLDVTFDIGHREDDFPTVTVDGPDATVARNLLREEFGEMVTSHEDGETYVGTLDSWDDDGFVLDVGFGQEVRIPADNLNLGQGSPAQIRKRFGVVQHMPLRFVAGDDPRLADEEVDRLYDWSRGNGRVNANSVTRSNARATVNRAGHAQDIVTVERIGLLEQSIVCNPDTDAPGILSDIGRFMQSELLAVVP